MRLKPAFVALFLLQHRISAHACRDPMAASGILVEAPAIALAGVDVAVRRVLSAV